MDPIEVVGMSSCPSPGLPSNAGGMERSYRTQRLQSSKNSEPLDFRRCGFSARESLLSCLGSVSFAKTVPSLSCMLLEELCRLHMHHLACALCFRLEAEHEELKKQASALFCIP